MTRRLIVTADDLGLTDGVCHAVHRAHVDGIVTSTSLLAVGRAFDTAATMLRDTPTLDLGVHLALVGEDPPLLSAREVPTLVQAGGGFPLSYRTVVARGLAGRIDPDDVRRELSAQLDRVLGLGLPVTHVDTHQHTHLWPSIARVVTELAVARAIPAVRLPRSRRRGPVGLGVNLLAGRLARRLDTAGLATTDDYAGLDESLAMDLAAFDRALGAIVRRPGAVAEINLHPGESGDPQAHRFGWSSHWAAELELATDPRAAALVARHGLRLGGFGDLRLEDA